MIGDVGLQCTGCKACGDICPKKAISYSINDEGFWYPKVDNSKCISCGKCREVCSALIERDCLSDDQPSAYAAWNRDESIRRESTSGGIYYSFAKEVLDKGGYIVGSVYADDFCSAHHTYTNRIDDLPRVIGSKYFQSDTEGIYITTKKLLQTGQMVLFTGTPCQVFSLKRFLNKEYDNLISIDFICRGVPSPKIQEMKIKGFEGKEHSKVKNFRDKCDKYAWTDFGEIIQYENGKSRFRSRWLDNIFDCFIKRNLNMRESCYNCKYKCGKNVSEITMGDFWGIKGVTEKDLKLGVSALIINNSKGKEFIEAIKNKIFTEQRPLSEIQSGNAAYLQSPPRPKNRDVFFQSINEEGLDKAVRLYSTKTLKERYISAKKVISMVLRKWKPVWKVKKDISWGKFIRYNYLCSNIDRDSDAYIIPLRGTVLQLEKRSKVILHGNLILNYNPSYRRGKQTTLFKVADEGVFVANNRVEISYNNTIVVNRKAKMETGYMYSNIGSNIISNCSITLGNNVLIGREVCIFDSDYHKIYNQNEKQINENKEVSIGDNVWIGTRSMIMKGAKIESGAVIGANTMVTGDVHGGKIYINPRDTKSIGETVFWER